MGKIKQPDPVKLFIGITFNSDVDVEKIYPLLEQEFGRIDKISPVIDFSSFTSYYEPEMGKSLQKVWVSFDQLIMPSELPQIKVKTNDLEVDCSGTDTQRDVNLDPGYIGQANLILATTKNYSHRIYLDKGIYGDVHYIYSQKKFQPQNWTYPDYKEPSVIEFFHELRELYLLQLKERSKDGHI